MGRSNRRITLHLLLMLVFLGVFCLSAYEIWQQLSEQAEIAEQNEALVEQAVTVVTPAAAEPEKPEEQEPSVPPVRPPIAVDFETLWQTNEDVVAWVHCEGTGISYPVAQGPDNNTYLRALLDGSYNRAGTIFMDYRNRADCSDWNTIIYGHNMQDDTMFGTLGLYRDPAYYAQHPDWWLLTPSCAYRVELLAGYTTRSDAMLYTGADSPRERDRVVELARQLSDFETDVAVGEQDKLVTFSTCMYETEDARYVLIGVLRPIN